MVENVSKILYAKKYVLVSVTKLEIINLWMVVFYTKIFLQLSKFCENHVLSAYFLRFMLLEKHMKEHDIIMKTLNFAHLVWLEFLIFLGQM